MKQAVAISVTNRFGVESMRLPISSTVSTRAFVFAFAGGSEPFRRVTGFAWTASSRTAWVKTADSTRHDAPDGEVRQARLAEVGQPLRHAGTPDLLGLAQAEGLPDVGVVPLLRGVVVPAGSARRDRTRDWYSAK